MKAIQDSVAAYLQACTGVRTVADRTRARGEYPLLAVSVREDGTVLVDGGRQAEHTYRVTVSAASDREREVNTALLSSLTRFLRVRKIILIIMYMVLVWLPVRLLTQ